MLSEEEEGKEGYVQYPVEGATIILPQTFLENIVSPTLPSEVMSQEELEFIKKTYYGFISSWATTTNLSEANVEAILWGLLALRSQIARVVNFTPEVRVHIDNLELMALHAAKKSLNGWLVTKIVPAIGKEEGKKRRWWNLF